MISSRLDSSMCPPPAIKWSRAVGQMAAMSRAWATGTLRSSVPCHTWTGTLISPRLMSQARGNSLKSRAAALAVVDDGCRKIVEQSVSHNRVVANQASIGLREERAESVERLLWAETSSQDHYCEQ